MSNINLQFILLWITFSLGNFLLLNILAYSYFILLSYLILFIFNYFYKFKFSNYIKFLYLNIFIFYLFIFFYNLIFFSESLVSRLVYNPFSDAFHGIEIYVFLALFYFAYINPKKINFLDFIILFLLFIINVFLSNRLATIIFLIFFFYSFFICNRKSIFIYLFVLFSVLALFFLGIFSHINDRISAQGLDSQRFELAVLGYDLILNNYSISSDWMFDTYSVTSFHFYLLDLFRVWNSYIILIIGTILLIIFFLTIFSKKLLSSKIFLITYFLFFFFTTPSFDLPSIILILTLSLLINLNENTNRFN